MNYQKIKIIIVREFLTRVRKKSFLILTLVMPFLFVLLSLSPFIIAKLNNEIIVIGVVDDTGLYKGKLKSSKKIKFQFLNKDFEIAKKELYSSDYSGVLYLNKITKEVNFEYVYKKQPGLFTINNLESQIGRIIKNQLLKENYHLTNKDLEAINPQVVVSSFYRDEKGKEQLKNNKLNSIIGYLSGVFIYVFIFFYGVQVMRGVIEEKSNRIVEIMISSVRPFELMLGKIIGVAFVSFAQFFLWAVLSFFLMILIPNLLGSFIDLETVSGGLQVGGGVTSQLVPASASSVLQGIGEMNWSFIIVCFLLFFFGGYLLYCSFFSAIGAMVDNEADTQQYMLPVTVPIIIALIMGQAVIDNPDGSLAFWGSIIPFTSPIVMMFRVSFGVPFWQVFLSLALLFITFILMTMFSAKIYRTAILLYGKKPSYKEIYKWLFSKGD